MSWLETRTGKQLWYLDRGAGTPLILIHGWCMSSEIWKLQVDGLSKMFRVITVDLPGHGRSEVLSEGFSVAGCCEVLEDLCSSLGISRAIVLGWSLGAFSAVELYRRARVAVSALILVGATPRFTSSDDFPYGLSPQEADGMAVKIRRNIVRALAGFHSLMLAPDEPDGPEFIQIVDSVILPSTDVALQALQALVAADLRPILTDICCQTLILHGDCDRICLPQASEFLQSHIFHSQRIIFSGCGHVPFISQSGYFNQIVSEFTRRVSGSTN